MTQIEAPITAVTVFVDRARILRRGSIRLTPGEHLLTLSHLPATIEEDSVRAAGRGANVRILGVETKQEFVTQPPEAAVAELRAQLESLQDRDRSLTDEDSAQAARLEFLKTLRESGGATLTRGLASGRTTIDTVNALAQYLTLDMTTVQERRRELAQQRRELAREIEAARRRLEQVQHVYPSQRCQIEVAVEVSAETEFELEVTYIVQGASWEPMYDIRLIESAVTVSYLALVRQQSSEDWPAVQLSLSTARPAVTATIPELTPWYLDIPRPLPPPTPAPMMARMRMEESAKMTMPSGGMAADYAAADEAMETAVMAAPIASAAIEQAGASVTYRVARPVAIPSDGSPHRTLVTTLDLGAKLDYVTAPKLAEEAYLRAKVKNTSEFALLPGTAAIFHDADFVGKTWLETVAPNEEFDVQLGVDDRLKVKRELVRRAVDKTLIGNTRRIQFAYKITLTSLLTAPTRVTVFDQLPVGRHESIKVKLQDTQPRPAEQSDLNILKWELTLDPQRKLDLAFAYTVEHPREMQVVGIE
jgi:uncharacterized protein (TIGR02231 family)